MDETFIQRIRIGIAVVAPARGDVDRRHIWLSIVNAMSTSESRRRNIGLTKL